MLIVACSCESVCVISHPEPWLHFLEHCPCRWITFGHSKTTLQNFDLFIAIHILLCIPANTCKAKYIMQYIDILYRHTFFTDFKLISQGGKYQHDHFPFFLNISGTFSLASETDRHARTHTSLTGRNFFGLAHHSRRQTSIPKSQ